MEKIAVVGIANLFPGSVTKEEFWQNLIQKKDTRTMASNRQMGVDPESYSGEEGDTDKYYCMRGGYIQDFELDCDDFALPADYLQKLDDMYQWSLYVGREALRDAGYLNDDDVLQRCGLILANLSFPTKSSNHLFLPLYHKTVNRALKSLLGNEQFELSHFSDAKQVHPANALIAGYPSAVVAQALSLGGSHFALDAACASSCYSAKLACDYLNTGKADLMLAGAVSGADPFFVNMGFSIFHAYPENNISAPLDKNSRGLYAGEGAGMIVLKRYADAVRDGDNIYSVIKGGGLSNDGRGEFVLSPNTKGQVLVYERAYADAGVDPKTVEYVECHATGTPKGDKVELGSMETFFGRCEAKPLIGSVKSNLAHLLTAAGEPAMMKVMLAMNEGKLPPTINLTNPTNSKTGYIGPEQIPTEVIDWPDRNDGGPRRAGVSVFGFGGSNAHLVFEQATLPAGGETPVETFESMAVVGMDAHFGGCDGLQQFSETLVNARQQFRDLPPQRWKGIEREKDFLKTMGIKDGKAPKGAYVEQFDMDFLRFRIPPNPNDCLIPQQLLMMKVADSAASEARLKPGSNVAVLVAMGIELELHQFRGRANLTTQLEQSLSESGIELSADQKAELEKIAKDSMHNEAQLNQYTSFIGNIMASRISNLWDFSGPAITVSAEENSVYRCLELAETLFQSSDVEAVVVAAVDLSGGVENVVLRNQFSRLNSGPQTLSLAEGVDGWMVGEGAGAVVLKRLDDAKRDSNKIYGALDAVAFDNGVDASSISKAADKALSMAGCKASDIDYLELYGSGVAEQDKAESDGLKAHYQGVIAGCVKANIGHTYSASGMASLIKAGLMLHHDLIPATPQWGRAKNGVPFNVITQAQAWSDDELHRIALNGLGMDGASSHVILSGVEGFDEPPQMPDSASNEKPKPKLVRTIVLGGPVIQDMILSTENKQRFASVRQTLQGKELSPVSRPLVLESNTQTIVVPGVTKSKATVTPILSTTTTQLHSAGETSADARGNAVSNRFDKDSQLLNCSQISRSHLAFLQSRQQSSEQMAELVRMQAAVALNQPVTGTAHAVQRVRPQMPPLVERYSKPIKVIWDQEALIEYAEGDIQKVFGSDYAIIDTYSRRVRLPTTDYLLVTRVTELDATINEYKPCKMVTEYDIPTDAPYLIDGQIPWAVSVESGQCDLMLISYLGIDFQNKGERVYRLLDCTLTFLEDMSFGGETLRYEIYIDSFARNGDTLLFFFHYDCFVGEKMVLTMRGGCAGFFTDEELAEGKGIIYTEDELEERARIPKQSFVPLITNERTQFEYDDIWKLIQGDIVGCLGSQYEQHGLNPTLKFSSEKFLMFERVTQIERTGGPWGLGLLEAEKRLEPEHWYFPCHFQGDQVMAGSLMAEGCGQLVMFFMMYLGMQTGVRNARFQPMPGEPQKVRCRGQVLPQSNTLTYRMEVTEIGMQPQPYMKANIDIILDGKVVVDFKNLGVLMKEQGANDKYVLAVPEQAISSVKTSAPVVETPKVEAPKDPFANPNAPLMKTEPDLEAPTNKGVIPIKHYEAPIIEGQNRVPNTVPFTPWHLFEFATGNISNCFGSDYDIYANLTPPRTPCGDLQLTTRVVKADGERGNFKKTSYCQAEYEVPTDAWYFTKNSEPGVMPYSVLMEISLQPNGFLSTYVGATLGFPGMELFFRNLDGTGKLLRKVDLRGKTIVNDSKLLSTSIAGSNIIQSFTFTLSVDGEPFYDGKAVFGYFLADALAHQLGLDNGRTTPPWHVENNRPAERIELTSANAPMFQAPAGKPHYRLAGGQLHFIDTVDIVEGGGKAGKGYIYSEREIDPQDWFFRYHFHQDPVMPGSLGLEAIMESMQVYALKNDLGAHLKNPRFTQILSTIVWKYRGQINPLNRQMSLDIHITDVIKETDRVTIIGDANLSKDGLRIYEVKDIAICLEELV